MFQNLEEKPEGEETDDTTTAAATLPADDSFAVSDKKPTNKWNVIGFFVIVAGGAIFCFIHMRGGPSAASAAATPNVQVNKTISQFLSGGTNDIQNMKTSLANTEKQVQIFQHYPSVHQVPLGNLKTNPFAYRGDDKTGTELAAKRAQQQAALEKSAGDLKLQSIMYSSRPNGRSACMINGSLCGIGGQVAGFTIEKINPNTVSIVQGDFRFDLKLEK